MIQKKGFSLVEIMVIIAITSLLATTMYASFNAVRMSQRDKKRLSDMRLVSLSLEVYRSNTGNYPASDGLGAGGWDTPQDGTFLKALVDNRYLPAHVLILCKAHLRIIKTTDIFCSPRDKMAVRWARDLIMFWVL